MAADVGPESVRVQLLVMAEADQRDLLSSVAVPTLLIWGELDARSPLGDAPVRRGNPGYEACRDPRLRTRQQPRASP
ncbi:MAG: hypothetical protein ABR505_08820 [Actinomycetota bacterium]